MKNPAATPFAPSIKCFAKWALFCALAASAFSENADRWWPLQAVPKAVVRTTRDFPEPRFAHDMLAQSMAGLAAKAVNAGSGDELVWVDTGNVDLEDWLARWFAKHLDVKASGTLGPWDLVDRFSQRGVIKGYILYRADTSIGDVNAYRPNMDCSVNVATSLAGLLDGIIIDEALEKTAREHGLKLLVDARGKTQAWCFETYRDQFNPRLLCTQDPRKPHVRDLAIAQKAFTLYGADEPLATAMKWLQPLSPILGWNGGDEFKTTDLSTRFGQIQTATDWCMNLPVLMAGSEKVQHTNRLSASAIDWNDHRSAVSFIQTDGDNVQWMEGNFFHANPDYWSNTNRGKIPFGWSSCFAQLTQLCPTAIDYALETRTANDSILEWGGGYYYPDHFASERSDRWDLLARHAARSWALMKKTHTRIIAFNVIQHDSADARKAFEIFARQTTGLLGILVFQYYPYEGGAGKTFWVKDRTGHEIPVVTARYALWEHSNERARSGTPAKIAREIREAAAGKEPRYDWVITHAWSYFKKAPGPNEDAENLQPGEKGERGYTPVTWCAERLPDSIRVVAPEELLWRIRMQHDPAETKRFMDRARASD